MAVPSDCWTTDKPDAIEYRVYSVSDDARRWATNLDRKTPTGV